MGSLSAVDRGRFVSSDRSVGRDRSIGRGRSVGRGRSISRCGLVGRGRVLLGLSRVGNISNISTVSISNLVVDSLDPAIRKSNRVGSRGGISIPVLTMAKGSSRVVISYTIVEGIDWGHISIGRGSRTIRWGICCWGKSISGSIVSCCNRGQSKNNEDLKIY